jgi:hypothetical protein
MAFGFPAYHEARARYDCSAGELMDAIDEALGLLGWSGSQTDRWSFSANTGVSLWSWGERVEIDVGRDGRLLIRSECCMPTQCIDWGRNRSNVERFLKKLDRIIPDADRDEDEDYR